MWWCIQEVWGGVSLLLSPAPQHTGLCTGSLARGCDSGLGRGQAGLPLLLRPLHTQHHPDLCIHVFHLKAFRATQCFEWAAVVVGLLLARMEHVLSYPHWIWVAMALSGKHCLAIWRWHLLSALGALLLEMLFFCFLCQQICVCSMVLKNLTWEKTFWICCSGIEGPVCWETVLFKRILLN